MAAVFTGLIRFYPNSSIFMCFCQYSSSDVIICSIFIYFVWIFGVESELLKTAFCQCQDLQDCGKVAVGGSSRVSFDFKSTLRYLSTLRVFWSFGVILMVLGVY